jgi:hypothetical protein
LAAPSEASVPRAQIERLDEGLFVLFGEDVGEPQVLPFARAATEARDITESDSVEAVPIDVRHVYLLRSKPSENLLDCAIFSLDDHSVRRPDSPCLQPHWFELELQKGPLDWVLVSSGNGCGGDLQFVRLFVDGSWRRVATVDFHGLENYRWSADGKSATVEMRCPGLDECPWANEELPVSTFEIRDEARE